MTMYSNYCTGSFWKGINLRGNNKKFATPEQFQCAYSTRTIQESNYLRQKFNSSKLSGLFHNRLNNGLSGALKEVIGLQSV